MNGLFYLNLPVKHVSGVENEAVFGQEKTPISSHLSCQT